MSARGGAPKHPNFNWMWPENDPAVAQLKVLWGAEALLDRPPKHVTAEQASGYLALVSSCFKEVAKAYDNAPTSLELAKRALNEAATIMPDVSAEEPHRPIVVSAEMQALYAQRQVRLPGIVALVDAATRQN